MTKLLKELNQIAKRAEEVSLETGKINKEIEVVTPIIPYSISHLPILAALIRYSEMLKKTTGNLISESSGLMRDFQVCKTAIFKMMEENNG